MPIISSFLSYVQLDSYGCSYGQQDDGQIHAGGIRRHLIRTDIETRSAIAIAILRAEVAVKVGRRSTDQ